MRDRRASREAEYRARPSRAPSPRATVCAADAKCPVAVGPIRSALTGALVPDFIRLGRDMEGASGGAGGGDPSPQGGVMTMGRKDLVEIKRRLLQVRAANPSRVTDDRVAPAHRSRCFPGYFFPSARAPRPDDALTADLSVASLDPNAARGSEPGGVLEPRLRVPAQAGVEG